MYVLEEFELELLDEFELELLDEFELELLDEFELELLDEFELEFPADAGAAAPAATTSALAPTAVYVFQRRALRGFSGSCMYGLSFDRLPCDGDAGRFP